MKDFAIFFSAVLLVYSCTQSGHDHSQDSQIITEEHAEMDPTKEVDLIHEQVKNIGITFEEIVKRPLRTLVKLNGRVELLPGGRAIATSLIEGQVMKVHIAPGQYVREGDILFTVSNMELIEWQESYLQDHATLDFIQKEIARQRPLVEQEISPLKKLEELESEEIKVKASMAAQNHRMA